MKFVDEMLVGAPLNLAEGIVDLTQRFRDGNLDDRGEALTTEEVR